MAGSDAPRLHAPSSLPPRILCTACTIRRYFDAVATAGGGLATIKAGPKQELRFRESPDTALGPPDVAYQNQTYGLHIAMYLYDQLTPMQKLATDNLLWGNPRFLELDTKLGLSQFRCKDIMMQVSVGRDGWLSGRRSANIDPWPEPGQPHDEHKTRHLLPHSTHLDVQQAGSRASRRPRGGGGGGFLERMTSLRPSNIRDAYQIPSVKPCILSAACGLPRSIVVEWGLICLSACDLHTYFQIASTREPVLLCELEHEVRTMQHASSPFGRMEPYTLMGREPIPQMINTVVPDEEGRNIAFERKQHMRRKQGYVPQPLGVCYKPIELFTWDTPNGKKISIIMEELKLPYVVRAINLKEGQQHRPEFREVSPLGTDRCLGSSLGT